MAEHIPRGEGPTPPDDDADERSLAVIVGTTRAHAVAIRRHVDDRTPEGYVCLEAVLAGRVIARQVVWPPIAEAMERAGLFAAPVRLALLVRPLAPGLQARLVALVPRHKLTTMVEIAKGIVGEQERERDPWSASVPEFRLEDAAPHEPDETDAPHSDRHASPGAPGAPAGPLQPDDPRTPRIGGLQLGHIVRFAADRKFPLSLDYEAADMLDAVLHGHLRDAEEKAIDDLLSSL